MFSKDEWTQKEFLQNKKELEKQGIEVVLIDTILKPLANEKTLIYNPFEMELYAKDTVFVFYCDTGKNTKERLNYYRNKFPNHRCVSLRGGRGYYRANFRLVNDNKNE